MPTYTLLCTASSTLLFLSKLYIIYLKKVRKMYSILSSRLLVQKEDMEKSNFNSVKWFTYEKFGRTSAVTRKVSYTTDFTSVTLANNSRKYTIVLANMTTADVIILRILEFKDLECNKSLVKDMFRTYFFINVIEIIWW